MDAALHSVDGSRCVKLGQTRASDTVCEQCYGTGCKNGYSAASRMAYVTSLQCLMDTTARCKVFLLFSTKVIGVGSPALSSYGVTVNIVMGVAQGFVFKFMVRSQQDNKTVNQ